LPYFKPATQTDLGCQLAQAILQRGPIPFVEFMRIALYDPDAGYYTAQSRPRFGWEGDFITSSDLGVLFGGAIGKFLARCWRDQGHPQRFIVREDGAGRGLLAHDAISPMIMIVFCIFGQLIL
jgi:SAM-dependent MidA family methyltransferase